MIKSAIVAMVVIGCDSDANQCEFIRETPAQWASVGECETEMKHQMLTDGNFDYPTVVGLCRAVDAANVQTAAAPKPEAAPRPIYAGVVEGGKSILFRTADGYTMVRHTLGRAALGTAEIARRTGGQLVDRLAATF